MALPYALQPRTARPNALPADPLRTNPPALDPPKWLVGVGQCSAEIAKERKPYPPAVLPPKPYTLR